MTVFIHGKGKASNHDNSTIARETVYPIMAEGLDPVEGVYCSMSNKGPVVRTLGRTARAAGGPDRLESVTGDVAYIREITDKGTSRCVLYVVSISALRQHSGYEMNVLTWKDIASLAKHRRVMASQDILKRAGN